VKSPSRTRASSGGSRCAGERRAVPAGSRLSGPAPAGDHAYTLVPAPDKVLDGRARSRHVVHVEVVEREIQAAHALLYGLEPDEGDVPLQQRPQVTGLQVEEDGHYAVHPALLQGACAPALLLRDAAGVVDDKVVPARLGHLLNPPLEGGIERVRDVGDDRGDRRSPLGPETAGGAVGHVPELVHRPQYAPAGRLRYRDDGVTVQHIGDRGLRDAGEPRHVRLRGPSHPRTPPASQITHRPTTRAEAPTSRGNRQWNETSEL
jgi:hypothetical protein